MKRNIKVSVIVPTYNDEKYIKRSIDSILAQTLEEIEIIIINDGSTDETDAICLDYETRYPNKIKIIRKLNQGQGMARNDGLKIASGDYVCFVDSDDWIEREMLEEMYTQAVLYDSEIVICDVMLINVKMQKRSIQKASRIDSIDVDIKDYFVNGSGQAYPVNKLYKRAIWNNYFFDKMTFEDLNLIPIIVSNCTKVTYIPKPFYNYYRREGSTSTTFKNISMLDIIKALRNLSRSSNVNYFDEIIYFIAKSIKWNLSTERRVFKAEFIEFINELSPILMRNSYILRDTSLRKIFDYVNYINIPKLIYYNNFDKAEEKYETFCLNSWSKYTCDFEIVPLDDKNCDIAKAPKSVQNAFIRNDTKFVGDYFKLKYLYENGGIALDKCVLFKSPIGELRTEKTFFGFKNQEEINDSIFGSLKRTEVLKELLNTYEQDDIFNANFLPLSERIRDLLIFKYGFRNKGWTQTLKNDIKVFRCDVLSYDMQSNLNVTKIYSPTALELEDTEFEVIEKSVLKYWSDDKNNFWSQKEKFRKELEEVKRKLDIPQNMPIADNTLVNRVSVLEGELEWHKGEILRYKNSKSWRVTRPLRWFINLFRRNKFTRDEVR